MPGGVAGAQLLWLPPMPIWLQPYFDVKNILKALEAVRRGRIKDLQILLWPQPPYPQCLAHCVPS
jgi:hypothetical protein